MLQVNTKFSPVLSNFIIIDYPYIRGKPLIRKSKFHTPTLKQEPIGHSTTRSNLIIPVYKKENEKENEKEDLPLTPTQLAPVQPPLVNVNGSPHPDSKRDTKKQAS